MFIERFDVIHLKTLVKVIPFQRALTIQTYRNISELCIDSLADAVQMLRISYLESQVGPGKSISFLKNMNLLKKLEKLAS